MTINHLNRIFSRHADALRRVSDNGDSIASDAALLSLALALDELATAMQQDNADADDQLARIERVLEAHDSALFADVASGRTPLATAIDALIVNERAAFAALSDDIMQANADRVDLRSQLAQMDADNARLSQELRTLRSWVTAPAGDGKSDPMSANVAAIIQKPAVDSLSQAASDYWIGLDAGRWSWRSVPRSVQLEMVRHVIAGTESHTKMEFDAVKPDWMPTATAQTQKFSATWSELSDLNREVQP